MKASYSRVTCLKIAIFFKRFFFYFLGLTRAEIKTFNWQKTLFSVLSAKKKELLEKNDKRNCYFRTCKPANIDVTFGCLSTPKFFSKLLLTNFVQSRVITGKKFLLFRGNRIKQNEGQTCTLTFTRKNWVKLNNFGEKVIIQVKGILKITYYDIGNCR